MFPDGTGVPMRQSIAMGRVFVVELLLHRPVTSLRAAVTTLRGGEIRPVEQIGVGVVRHRGELLGRRPAPPRAHVAPQEHRLHPAYEGEAAVVSEYVPGTGVEALRRVDGARETPGPGR